MTVRFSTRCPNSDYLGFEASPEAIVAAAKKAEEVGFDAIFLNDHIAVGDDPRSAPWTNGYDPFCRDVVYRCAYELDRVDTSPGDRARDAIGVSRIAVY